MVRMKLKDFLRKGRLLSSTSMFALLTSPFLLLSSASVVQGGSSVSKQVRSKNDLTLLVDEVIKQFNRKNQILDLAKEGNERSAKLLDKIFDLKLDVGGTDVEIKHVGNVIGSLDELTERRIVDPRSPEEKISYYLDREGRLIFEIASLDIKVRRLKRFEVKLSELRQSIYALRAIEDEIDRCFDRLRLLKRRVDVSKIAFDAAYSNNWNMTKESLLYLFGFKWLWGLFTGYQASTSYGSELAKLRSLSGEQERERPKIEAKIKQLEERLVAAVNSVKLSLTEILKDAPSVRSAFRVRVGVTNLLNLFLASIKARERVSSEETKVEKLIDSGALKRNKLVSYLSGLRVTFDSSDRLFSEYDVRLEDEKDGGDYAFSNLGGGPVEIWKPFSSGETGPAKSTDSKKDDKKDQTGKFTGAQRDELASKYWDFKALGGIEVADLRKVIPFAWTTSIVSKLTWNPQVFVTEGQRWIEEAQVFYLRPYSEAVREYASITAQLNDVFRPTPLSSNLLRENSLEAILSLDGGLLEEESKFAKLRAELDAVRYQLKGVGKILTSSDLERLLDREIEKRRDSFESILTSPKLARSLSDGLSSVNKERGIFLGLNKLLDEAYKARSILESLNSLEMEHEQLRDRFALNRFTYERRAEEGYSLRGEIYQYLFGFKWFWGAFIGYAPTSISLTNQFSNLLEAKKRLDSFESNFEAKRAELERDLGKQIGRTLGIVARLRASLPEGLLVGLNNFELLFKRSLEDLRVVIGDYISAHRLFSEQIELGSEIDAGLVDPETLAPIVNMPKEARELFRSGRKTLVRSTKSWVGLKREREMIRYRTALDLLDGVKHNLELAFNLLPAILNKDLLGIATDSRDLVERLEDEREVSTFLLKHLYQHKDGLARLLLKIEPSSNSQQHLNPSSLPMIRDSLVDLDLYKVSTKKDEDVSPLVGEGATTLLSDSETNLLLVKVGGTIRSDTKEEGE